MKVIIVRQEVKPNGSLLQIQKVNMVTSPLKPIDISQLPILNKIQTSHNHKTLGEVDSFETLTSRTEGITSGMISILTFR